MVFSKQIPKRGHYGEPARVVFRGIETACLLWVGLALLGDGCQADQPLSLAVFFLLEMEGKLSLPHSPSWSNCLGNTSIMCEVLPFPFTQPQGKQILTSGAPAIARGHIHSQERLGRRHLWISTPPPHTHTLTHTLLVWMGVKSDQEVEVLASLRIQ